MLLAALFLFTPFTAEAAKIRMNKKKATQPCNTFMTVLELKGATKGKVVWKSSNKKVATCEPGGNHCIVASHKAGKAKITAKYKGKTYTCKVTVKDKPEIDPSQLTLITGEVGYISVSGTAKKAKWSVDNKSIVKLSKDKRVKYTYTVKGLKPGTAKVTVKVGKKKMTCKVKVTNAPIVADEPQEDE